MLSERTAVDLIERAHDRDPYCACGRHTVPVWRDGMVWLECSVFSEPVEGLLRRIVAAVTAPIHLHRAVLEVPGGSPTPVESADAMRA